MNNFDRIWILFMFTIVCSAIKKPQVFPLFEVIIAGIALGLAFWCEAFKSKK